MKPLTKLLLHSFSFIFMIVLNGFGASGKLTGKNVGELSDKYFTAITPAGFTFGIWSIIFTLLLVFLIFQWYIYFKPNKSDSPSSIWFTISNIANGTWIIAWTNEELWLSLGIILVLLFSLIKLIIEHKLELWDAPVRTIAFVWWPICIYAGWIILATVVNAASVLKASSIGLPETPLAIFMLITATFIYAFLIVTRNMREAAVVGAWGFFGIYSEAHPESVQNTALILSAVLLIAAGIHGFKNHETSPFLKLRRGEWRD